MPHLTMCTWQCVDCAPSMYVYASMNKTVYRLPSGCKLAQKSIMFATLR
ncbi:Uncharacterised protein [Vibrio cholerae]|nr:Uncharacterised protein [Vibrio cholerae]CSI47320.1 Uncharacterised protein [Vibrio cholerae]CSI74087.1 Uncharacterised protein [Vibrio cholerae]